MGGNDWVDTFFLVFICLSRLREEDNDNVFDLCVTAWCGRSLVYDTSRHMVLPQALALLSCGLEFSILFIHFAFTLAFAAWADTERKRVGKV